MDDFYQILIFIVGIILGNLTWHIIRWLRR